MDAHSEMATWGVGYVAAYPKLRNGKQSCYDDFYNIKDGSIKKVLPQLPEKLENHYILCEPDPPVYTKFNTKNGRVVAADLKKYSETGYFK